MTHKSNNCLENLRNAFIKCLNWITEVCLNPLSEIIKLSYSNSHCSFVFPLYCCLNPVPCCVLSLSHLPPPVCSILLNSMAGSHWSIYVQGLAPCLAQCTPYIAPQGLLSLLTPSTAWQACSLPVSEPSPLQTNVRGSLSASMGSRKVGIGAKVC